MLGLYYFRAQQFDRHETEVAKWRGQALTHFLLSHNLSELLRDRIPTDRIGLSQAGFFARRAYVNEKIIELLVDQGDAAEALYYAELAKARSLHDLLVARGIHSDQEQSWAALSQILGDWPDDVTTAIEYFVGTERSWAFVIDRGGGVTPHLLAGNPRELIVNVNGFLAGLNDTLGKMKVGAGYRDWQAFRKQAETTGLGK